MYLMYQPYRIYDLFYHLDIPTMNATSFTKIPFYLDTWMNTKKQGKNLHVAPNITQT